MAILVDPRRFCAFPAQSFNFLRAIGGHKLTETLIHAVMRSSGYLIHSVIVRSPERLILGNFRAFYGVVMAVLGEARALPVHSNASPTIDMAFRERRYKVHQACRLLARRCLRASGRATLST